MLSWCAAELGSPEDFSAIEVFYILLLLSARNASRIIACSTAEDTRGGIFYLGGRARIKRLYMFSTREEDSALKGN